ncbi:MAG: DUF177 domain-containing protein [Gammaproteobacteria bacterium]|nr:DUF177 domain-containing protein [Gammaproteobacteria bacterium]
MSKPPHRLPHQLDPFRLAEAGVLLSGSLPLAQLRRLTPLLADDQGEIRLALQFDIDELKVPCMTGRIEADLQLACQRCLEPYLYKVAHNLALAWVRSDLEIERLPTRYEPYLVEATPVMLNDVIEEELLLALPQVPLHPDQSCSSKVVANAPQSTTAAVESRANPFAVLANLKTTRKSK